MKTKRPKARKLPNPVARMLRTDPKFRPQRVKALAGRASYDRNRRPDDNRDGGFDSGSRTPHLRHARYPANLQCAG